MNIAAQLNQAERVSTVFTITEIQTILGIENRKQVYNALFYAVKTGDLIKISRGIYAFSANYSRKELGNKYRRPSYVSSYTVLYESGIVFQPYTSIYLMSNRSEKVNLAGQNFIYRKIKNEILLNPYGVRDVNNVQIASVERALCDQLYLNGLEFFDNLTNVNWLEMKKINRLIFHDYRTINLFIERNYEST